MDGVYKRARAESERKGIGQIVKVLKKSEIARPPLLGLESMPVYQCFCLRILKISDDRGDGQPLNMERRPERQPEGVSKEEI